MDIVLAVIGALLCLILFHVAVICYRKRKLLAIPPSVTTTQIKEAIGVAASTRTRAKTNALERAMTDAVNKAIADGVPISDTKRIKEYIMEAREQHLRSNI